MCVKLCGILAQMPPFNYCYYLKIVYIHKATVLLGDRWAKPYDDRASLWILMLPTHWGKRQTHKIHRPLWIQAAYLLAGGLKVWELKGPGCHHCTPTFRSKPGCNYPRPMNNGGTVALRCFDRDEISLIKSMGWASLWISLPCPFTYPLTTRLDSINPSAVPASKYYLLPC